MLLEEVEEILDKSGFDYSEYFGCFDLVARKKENTYLLKILNNVDSFQFTQANNLKILSKSLKASSMLIGEKTRREKLKDNIIYDRFNIPTITVKTFENIMFYNKFPFICRFRGGLFVEVNPDKLKASRERSNLTQKELAEEVGVTKKNIYEHEKNRMKILYEVAKKMEMVLKVSITEPFSFEKDFNREMLIEKNEPRNEFENLVSSDLRRIGFDTEFIYQTPFNIVAEEEKSLILSEAEDNKKRIDKNTPYIKEFSDITKRPVLIVTKEELSIDLPTIEEKELKGMDKKSLNKILKKW